MSYLKKLLILIVILLMSGCKGSSGVGGSNLPVANAGQNQTISVGNSVTLDGNKSYDPNGYPLTYWWKIEQRPIGSNATLSVTNLSQPTFLVDQIGKYGISLTVSSQSGVSASSTVSVTGIASSAAWHHLTSIPSDRQIYSIAIDPVNTNTLYAGSGFSDGIYKTTDGGSTWVTTSTGLYLTSSTDLVTILEVDPNNTSTIYAAVVGGNSALYKSTNAGISWQVIEDSPVSILTIDPQNSSILYQAIGSSLSQSTNGGLTWTALSTMTGTDIIDSIIVDPSNHQTLYVLVSNEGIYKSTDGGITWQLYSSSPISSFIDLVIDPNNTKVLYSSSTSSAALKSTDSGVTWTDMSLPAASLYVNPVDTNIVYSVGLPYGVVMSLDGGITPDPIGPSLTSPSTIMRGFPLGFAIDTSNYNTLYLAADGAYKYY